MVELPQNGIYKCFIMHWLLCLSIELNYIVHVQQTFDLTIQKIEANSSTSFTNDTKSKFAGLSSHYSCNTELFGK